MARGQHAYYKSSDRVSLAHRGGAREAPENTLTAFKNAYGLGFRYFETDVRATLDGHVVVFHDSTLQRVTDGFGSIDALPLREVKRASVAGVDPILTLEELAHEFPDCYFNIDVKADSAVDPFVSEVERLDLQGRICVASFSIMRLRRIRGACGPEVTTSMAPAEVAALVASSRLGPLARLSDLAISESIGCAQVPVSQNGIPIITESFVRAAHDRDLDVHAWTINDSVQMEALLDMGVDGIVTDVPTSLRAVLDSRSA